MHPDVHGVAVVVPPPVVQVRLAEGRHGEPAFELKCEEGFDLDGVGEGPFAYCRRGWGGRPRDRNRKVFSLDACHLGAVEERRDVATPVPDTVAALGHFTDLHPAPVG